MQKYEWNKKKTMLLVLLNEKTIQMSSMRWFFVIFMNIDYF